MLVGILDSQVGTIGGRCQGGRRDDGVRKGALLDGQLVGCPVRKSDRRKPVGEASERTVIALTHVLGTLDGVARVLDIRPVQVSIHLTQQGCA